MTLNFERYVFVFCRINVRISFLTPHFVLTGRGLSIQTTGTWRCLEATPPGAAFQTKKRAGVSEARSHHRTNDSADPARSPKIPSPSGRGSATRRVPAVEHVGTQGQSREPATGKASLGTSDWPWTRSFRASAGASPPTTTARATPQGRGVTRSAGMDLVGPKGKQKQPHQTENEIDLSTCK